MIPDSVKSARRDSLYAGAETLARRAVTADSSRAEGHFALAAAIGRASLTMGKKDRIRRAAVIRDEALKRIAIDPRYDGAYHILGRWNAEIMRLSGLSRFFAKSFLGAGVFGKASWDAAISNMEKAVELDPGRIYHRLELAEIYIDRKRYADATRELDEAGRTPRSRDHGPGVPPPGGGAGNDSSPAASRRKLLEDFPGLVCRLVETRLQPAPSTDQLPLRALAGLVEPVLRLLPEPMQPALELPSRLLTAVRGIHQRQPGPEQGAEDHPDRKAGQAAPAGACATAGAALEFVIFMVFVADTRLVGRHRCFLPRNDSLLRGTYWSRWCRQPL